MKVGLVLMLQGYISIVNKVNVVMESVTTMPKKEPMLLAQESLKK